MNNDQLYERYQRQLILKGFGAEAQQKLLSSSVLVIGAGGLGCPVLQYLVAAGVGSIGIVDDDVVALSNLHRQVLYNVQMIGRSKVECAVEVLQQSNPQVKFTVYNERFTNKNATAILSAFDVVVDGSDNFATRYLVNDACVLLNKPLVYGAISQYEGQVAVFNAEQNNERTANYRDIFPHPPKEGEVLNCAEAGVLGVLPGIIGSMMANETIKLITGTGVLLANKLFTYNTLNNQTYELELSKQADTASLIPASIQALEQTDYEWLCSNSATVNEIDVAVFNEMVVEGKAAIVDVREKDELPVVTEFSHMQISLSQLQQHTAWLTEDTIVVFCMSGKRSAQAAKQLNDLFGASKKIYSLKGGIQQWIQQQKQTV
ncbi:HesA/MoeB/ThiF family protein [Lacibacter sediminis]|uniref:Molybdopterin-synthase adenylyltransferase n=1 Tax=Lacibacter sediminis TaxID=2760713 RepID=A0A7G5XL77_9BACT|nr:HesA/MoeB/ThiF family protein [Lacibacter sediminis]QNA46230.1 molybdopterin-synthase adenylyltransferase MoeB [Lacibacter sediminis]